MGTKIVLNDITVLANIGVTDAEQAQKQPLFITVSFEYDASQAQHSDRIEDAVDYASIRADIIALTQSPVRLLEHLLHRIKTHITQQYPVTNVQVAIKKPNAFSDVAYVCASA
jgi:dihydroneopterin aldolase